MKRLLWLLLLSVPAFAQNATVTANLKQLGGGAAQPTGASIRVDLQNCTSPRVPGTGNIGEKSRTFYPNTSGVASITLFSNTVIDCGSGVPITPVSFYTFNLVSNGGVTSLGSYKVPAGASTLDSLPPMSVPPVIPTPTGDTTYLRIDGGNWSGLPTFPPTVPNWSVAGAITGSSVTAGIINSVVIAGSYASLNAASAACPLSGGCTIEVNNTVSLSANLTLPATTTLQVNQPGVVNRNAFTLTINGPIAAGAYQIFSGSGTVTFGSQINLAPVAWFGATPDGSSGTDDTTAIQATINALQIGNAWLSAGSYRVTAPISIAKSNVGIIGVGMRTINGGQYSTPPASVLVNTTGSTDTIDVAGTSLSSNVTFTTLQGFNVERSVAPTGTAKGISLSFTYAATIKNVGSLDSVYLLYVHASGSQGTGKVEDFMGQWGYNGFSEASGNYYGIYIDSSDNNASPSFRVRHSFVVDGNGSSSVVSYGLASVGTQVNDLMTYGFETATVDYGVFVHQTGVNSVITSADIHFYGGINDGCVVSCYLIQGLTSTGGAGLEINGGYLTISGSSPMVDIESSFGVRVSGVQMGVAANANPSACVDVNASSDVALVGNECMGVRNVGFLLNGSTAVAITGNDIRGNASVNGLIALVNSSLNAIGMNVLTGTGASIVVDSSSNANSGLNTNTIAATLTAAVNAGNNPVFNGSSSWSANAGAPSGACANGSFYSNSAVTVGTFATYACKGGSWVGQGTAY